MSRLIIVSNRVADPRNAAQSGGLAVAVSEALERRPSSSFLVEAAAPPSAGSPASARRQADRVVRTLIEMGVPRERIDSTDRLAADALADEVRIYVR